MAEVFASYSSLLVVCIGINAFSLTSALLLFEALFRLLDSVFVISLLVFPAIFVVAENRISGTFEVQGVDTLKGHLRHLSRSRKRKVIAALVIALAPFVVYYYHSQLPSVGLYEVSVEMSAESWRREADNVTIHINASITNYAERTIHISHIKTVVNATGHGDVIILQNAESDFDTDINIEPDREFFLLFNPVIESPVDPEAICIGIHVYIDEAKAERTRTFSFRFEQRPSARS